MESEHRDRWIRSIAEGAQRDVSSALGLLEGASDPEVRAVFRPLVQQLEDVRRALSEFTR